MEDLLTVLSAGAAGVGSALFPLINAEALAAVAGTAGPWMIVALVLALALGQTIGKLLLFEAGRRGSERFGSSRAAENKWMRRVMDGLTDPRTAVPVVLAAASVGLPPLAVVSVAAGIAGQRRDVFAVVCLVGRVARFAAIALPMGLVVAHG